MLKKIIGKRTTTAIAADTVMKRGDIMWER
jgi:hypothetical protein